MATKGSGFADASPVVKVLLGVLIAGAVGGIYYSALHMSLEEELEAEQRKLEQNQQAFAKAQARARRFAEVQREWQQRQALDRRNRRVLPESAEIPVVIRELNRLAETSGLQILSVRPQAEQRQELYVRIPVALSLSGRFHQVARFIYSVGRLERIINMEDVKLTNPKVSGDDVMLSISLQATTFRRPEGKKG